MPSTIIKTRTACTPNHRLVVDRFVCSYFVKKNLVERVTMTMSCLSFYHTSSHIFLTRFESIFYCCSSLKYVLDEKWVTSRNNFSWCCAIAGNLVIVMRGEGHMHNTRTHSMRRMWMCAYLNALTLLQKAHPNPNVELSNLQQTTHSIQRKNRMQGGGKHTHTRTHTRRENKIKANKVRNGTLAHMQWNRIDTTGGHVDIGI